MGQDEALRKRHEFILAAALLFFAAFVRVAPIGAGLPYISYIDEGHVLHPAIEILKSRTFDSTRFTYPPLTSYLTIVAARVYAPVYRLVHHRRLQSDLPRDEQFRTELGENYDLITPAEIIWLARLVVAGLSFGTVAFAGAIAKRLAGTRAALFAILFTGFCPALVSRGSIAIIDTTAAFFAMGAICFCQRLHPVASKGEALPWREAALAGLTAGLAVGAKYTVGVVFLAVIFAIGALRRTLREKAKLLGVAAAGLVLGIFCGVPAALLHPSKIIGELHAQVAFYQSIRSEQNYWTAALSVSEIGIPLLIAGLAGVVAMLLKRKTRLVALGWIGFAALLLSAVVWPSFQPFRNLLSLVPLLCIAAGASFFDEIIQYLERRKFARHAAPVVMIAVSLFALPSAWASISYLHIRLTRVDSRIQAIDWLQRNATKEMKILGLRELGILPGEWNRLPAGAVVLPWREAADRLERERFDFVVTGEMDLRYLPEPDRWRAYREHWASLTAAMPARAVFGAISTPVVPYLWRTNDEHVLILEATHRTP